MAERSSVAAYVEEFHRLGRARAYVQRRGYRTGIWSYRRVAETSVRFARELEARGIRKGERVMLWGENCAEWVVAFFGCALLGAVVVPMDSGAVPSFTVRVFHQVDARLMVCARRHAPVPTGGNNVAIPFLILEDLSETLATRSAAPISHSDVSPKDILQIVFTSGSTAEPKGVVITHANVLSNIAPLEERIRPYLKYERLVHPVRFLNLLPLSHVFGQFLGMFLPSLLRGVVIFQEELKPSEVIRTIKRERASVLVSVPRVLQSLQQKLERDWEEHDLSEEAKQSSFQKRFDSSRTQHFLRRWWTFRGIHRQFGWKFWAFISGGATLDADTEEFWGRLGYAVIQGSGLTEHTSLISVNHPFKLGKGSIGKILPGREVKLADDGEILVRGSGVASSYWSGNTQHAVADEQGWYRTGDIGALDDAGNLYFKGRKKEVIVTPGGTNVYPEDLEAALRRQPEVKDCVVIGIERGGNAEPCAVIILRDGASVEKVVERANQSLAEFQRIKMSFAWPEEDFPRTPTQKPRRNLIREIADAQLLGPTHTNLAVAAGNNPLADLIAKVTGRAIPSLRADVNLDSDLGLSSLDRVELLGAIEDRYQVDLAETRFSSAATVADLENILRRGSAPRAGYHYPRWALRWPVTWLRLAAHYLLLRPAIILLGWPRIEGRTHLLGRNGPMLVVCNHIDDVDAGFVLTALPARFRHRLATAAGGEALEALRTPPPDRNFFLKIFDRVEWALGVSLLNVFPLPRAAGFRQSFAYAGEAVDRGYNVLVFPEGRHTVDGKMNPFRAGVGLLANNLNIPVLPMRILGLFEVKRAGKRFAAPWKIRVRIGEPITFPPGSDPEQIARKLQQTVEAL
jgi:long-chain acyl-CoA synthetase